MWRGGQHLGRRERWPNSTGNGAKKPRDDLCRHGRLRPRCIGRHEPVSPHVLLQDWEHEEAITLDDTPFMRVMLTLRACYPQEREFVSAAARWYALQRLLEEHALAAWVKPEGEDAWQVDTAVFFVAATAPLDAKGKFLLEPFCEALTRWVEEHPDTNKDGQP